MYTYESQLEEIQDDREIYILLNEVEAIERSEKYPRDSEYRPISDTLDFFTGATDAGQISLIFDDSPGCHFPMRWLYDILIGEIVREINFFGYKVEIGDCNDFDGNVHLNGGYVVEICKVCPGYFGDHWIENAEELLVEKAAKHPLLALLQCWAEMLEKMCKTGE